MAIGRAIASATVSARAITDAWADGPVNGHWAMGDGRVSAGILLRKKLSQSAIKVMSAADPHDPAEFP